MSVPVAMAKPQIDIFFDLDGLEQVNYGHLFTKFEFKGMVNSGYVIKATLFDGSFILLDKLISAGYFVQAQLRPISVKFRILAGPDGEYPASATRMQTAILTSVKGDGQSADQAMIDFIAIDPPSWLLSVGDCSGKVYKGRIDQVIKSVVQDYASNGPYSINLEIGRTTDSSENRWWMMRQDPKSFIKSLTDWSSSVTLKKTQWLTISDGFNLIIKEQGDITSQQRAYYRYLSGQDPDTIKDWSMLADNSLSLLQTQLITNGLSAVSGQYLDIVTDKQGNKVVVSDDSTSAKQIAKVSQGQAFGKPPSGPTFAGWTSVTSVPEIYSAGDLGQKYEKYIDGRPRTMWLNTVNALQRMKFQVLGHGEWSDCRGLGTDTIFVKWTRAKTNASILEDSGDNNPFWWTTGNWLVYGFHHVVTRAQWYTDLYCARFDYDSAATKVGGTGS